MPSLIVTDLGGVVVKTDPRRCHRCWSELSPLSLDEVGQLTYPNDMYEALERDEILGEAYLTFVRQSWR